MPTQGMVSEESSHSRLSESRFEELLDVAAEVFFEHGFDAASVGEMAQRAKASKGTFYSRYPTKALLFKAVIHKMTDRAAMQFADILRTDQDVKSTLLRYGHELHTIILSTDVIKLQRIIAMEAPRFPDLGLFFYEAAPGRLIEQLSNYLSYKSGEGILSVPHPRIAAEQLSDAIIGEVNRVSVYGVREVSTRDRNQRLNVAVEGFLKAYQVKP